MEKEFEIELANGFTIGIYNSDGDIAIGLINSNGYMVSDISLTGDQLEQFKEVAK